VGQESADESRVEIDPVGPAAGASRDGRATAWRASRVGGSGMQEGGRTAADMRPWTGWATRTDVGARLWEGALAAAEGDAVAAAAAVDTPACWRNRRSSAPEKLTHSRPVCACKGCRPPSVLAVCG
jgi:hypothetical protein